MKANRSTLLRHAAAATLAALALAAAGTASAQVNWSIGVESPRYYEPAPVYRAPPPPVYYQPPPVYYQQPPTYYRPPPPPGYYQPGPGYVERRDWRHDRGYEQPQLSDMQQRALNNCSMLAWRDQPRCRATVMSTVR